MIIKYVVITLTMRFFQNSPPVGVTSVGVTSVGVTSVGVTSVGVTSVGVTSVGVTSLEKGDYGTCGVIIIIINNKFD